MLPHREKRAFVGLWDRYEKAKLQKYIAKSHSRGGPPRTERRAPLHLFTWMQCMDGPTSTRFARDHVSFQMHRPHEARLHHQRLVWSGGPSPLSRIRWSSQREGPVLWSLPGGLVSTPPTRFANALCHFVPVCASLSTSAPLLISVAGQPRRAENGTARVAHIPLSHLWINMAVPATGCERG